MEKYYLRVPKWDSLRVELLPDKVINHSHIGKKIQKVVVETAEVVGGADEEKPLVEMSVWNEEKGIKVRWSKEIRQCGNNKSEERYVIQINAKMLGSDYFEGINQNNIRKVYDYLQSFKVLEFTYDSFLDGYVYDCDLCYDVSSTPEVWNGLCRKVHSMVKMELLKYVPDGWKDNSKNVGLEFNSRNAGTPAHPFIKLYHKGLELTHSSYEFNKNFIKKNNLPIGRLEYNFKRRKHFEYFDVEVRTLRDLLGLGVGVLNKMLLGAISKFYLEKRTIVRNTTKLGPQEYYLKYLVGALVDSGKGDEWFMRCVSDYKKYSDDVADSQIARLKGYIKKSLDDDSWKVKLEQNNAVDELFRDFV
jgi:hypothetical protein